MSERNWRVPPSPRNVSLACCYPIGPIADELPGLTRRSAARAELGPTACLLGRTNLVHL
jgi:hypothetical protein